MPEIMRFDENELRVEARRRISLGHLPCVAQHYLWAGPGDGRPCSLCDRPIDPRQIEYELEFPLIPEMQMRFHRICHQVWELECDWHTSVHSGE